MKLTKIVIIYSVFLGFAPLVLNAHPHMFLNSSFQVVSEKGIFTQVNVLWEMDQYFSSSIIYDYDRNKDGLFSANEIKQIEQEAFSNLKNYNYFSWFRGSGKARIAIKRVSNFSASQSNGTVYYSFSIPLKDYSVTNEFWFAIFDISYFCQVRYTDVPVEVLGDDANKVSTETIIDKSKPIYYNPYGSVDDMRVYKEWKKGLETAYLTEIHCQIRPEENKE